MAAGTTLSSDVEGGQYSRIGNHPTERSPFSMAYDEEVDAHSAHAGGVYGKGSGIQKDQTISRSSAPARLT